MIRISCFKQSSDDWYGNYKIANDVRHEHKKYVEASLIELHNGDLRVCVWGNDDCGMEKDFSNLEYSSAFEMYCDICCTATISMKLLEGWGFSRA